MITAAICFGLFLLIQFTVIIGTYAYFSRKEGV